MALVLVLMLAASPPEQEQARALVRTAKEAFDAGDFARAAQLLNEAKALVPTGATLYNLGRALERAGDLTRAIEAYREYLVLAPASSDRKAVEATVEDLQRRLDERRRLVTLEGQGPKLVMVPVEVKRRSAARQVLPWVVAAVGLAAVGTGVGLGVSALDAHRRAVSDSSAERSEATQTGAIHLAQYANVLYVAGGVVLAAGLLWLVLERAFAEQALVPVESDHAP